MKLKYILFLFYFSLSFFSFAQTPNGVTVAGGNGRGFAANQLDVPSGFYIDGSGNIFIADASNHRIQKWTPGATQGITVAGGNGVGSAANQLSNPVDVFVDGSGNIFIADASNNRIQKWPSGATQGITVAGGNGYGSAANQLEFPNGIYIDGLGNIFIADTQNYRIQKWTPGATQGITVAGGNGYGAAANQLKDPSDVFVDGLGNIYVVDKSWSHRIQKWTPGATQGITIAGGNGDGSAANQLSNPDDIFVDGLGNIFIADDSNHRIQKWTLGATQGITVAGGNGYGSAANQLNAPSGVFIDGSGSIFVIDTYNSRIQKFPPINQLPTPALTVEKCSNQDFCLQLSLSTTAPYTGRRQEFLISTTQDFEGTDAWGYNSTGNLVVNLYNGDSFNKNFQYNTTYYIRARVENIYDNTFSDYVYATHTFTANNIKLNTPISFSGGIPELTTGKTYNLEFGLKNTGTTAWQGDIYWKLNNGTYRLSNSNISIPVGGSGVFTTSYSPTTSEVGNNLPVGIYTKTTGSGVYDLAGVVNGTQNPISINIKLPSTAVEKPIPFIRLDKVEYLPGEVVTFYCGNFAPNEAISIVPSVGNPVNLSTMADGSLRSQFTIPSTAQERNLDVMVWNAKGDNPSWSAFIKQSESSTLKITKPYKSNSTIVYDRNGYITIEFTDKILSSFPNTSVGVARKNYQYKISYRNESTGIVTNLVTTIKKNAIPYSDINEKVSIQLPISDFPVGSSKNISFFVTDSSNNQRFSASPIVTIQTVGNNTKVSKKWDKSFDKSIASDPTGIAADGVARMYLVAEKASATGSAIQSVSVSLTSNDGANDAEWVGKIKFASTQNNSSYSEEANGITTTTASSGTSLSQYWFWYVAPDDFMRNGMPYTNESEREITANFTFYFTDGTSASNTHKITIVRPPVMLVHGLGGSASSTWDAFPLRKSTIFKQIEALDMYPNKEFVYNAVVLVGEDGSKVRYSFQYQLQKMRVKGYACNQVDYICHSMGGAMLRTVIDNYRDDYYQTGTSAYNPNKTYGKGFVNKFITLDTPHNGSPWGDLITAIAPRLPWGVKLAISNLLNYSDVTNPYIQIVPGSLDNNTAYEFEATGAVKNLQVFASNGGVNFKEMNGIPSHLIAGDVIQGSGVLNVNLAQELLKDESFSPIMKTLFPVVVDYLSFNKYKVDSYAGEPGWLPSFKNVVNTKIAFNVIKDPKDKVKIVIETLTEFVKAYYPSGTSDIFYDGDFIVPLSSQTAGFTSGSQISILNEKLLDISKNHVAITEDVTTANRVKLLLNSSITSTYFTTTIPENKPINTPSGGGGGGSFRLASTQTSTNRPFVESFDKTKIEIVSPTTLSNLKVGQNIAVKVNVKDLAYLKRVELVFQSNIYGDTLINSNYSFYPTVETSMLGKQLIVATATYVKNDSVFFKMDTLSVNIMTDETVEIFRVSPKYTNIGLDEKFIPNFNIGYGKFISHYVDKSKLAVNISNPSVLSYDNIKGRFVGLQKGESQVVFTYEGKKDTIYIAVADGGIAYTSSITTGTISTPTTVCPGGVVQVAYTTSGTFGVGNQFLIQISDLTGKNFQTLETLSGTLLTTYLPKNLKAGNYKIRIMSTNDPIIGTVSSSVITVQKYSNPPTITANKTTFVEGEKITLIGSGCPNFYEIQGGFGARSNNFPLTISPIKDMKIIAYCTDNNPNSCYSDAATPLYLTKEPCSTSKDLVYSGGRPRPITYESDRVNVEEASNYITATNKLATSNTYNEYHAGKYVLLNPGFEVKGGATFKASINGCNNTNTKNLISYYPFNHPNYDESGNNNGTGFVTGQNNFSVITGKNSQNKCISINTSPLQIVGNNHPINNTTNASYSFWVKTTINQNNTNQKYAIISQSINSNTPLSFSVGYETTSGSYFCQVENSSNLVGKKIAITNNNQWVHIVAVLNYSDASMPNFPLTSDSFTIYVNGVKATNTLNFLSGGISSTSIKSYKTGNYNFFYYAPTSTTFLGQFDDFRIYDKALTDAEVLQIYNSEKP